MLTQLFRVDRRRYCWTTSIVLFVIACAGCGKKSTVAAVRGKVLLDDQPLTAGAIMTLPKGGRGAQGAIHNGEFELGTFAKNDGALIGTHQVAIVAYEGGLGRGPEAKLGKLLVPQRYTNPETSGLTIEVEPGENTPTLKLTSP
jgi:hypothetical protein